MSADMMLVCREEGTTFDGIGKEGKEACFITETSMGTPHDEFGDYMSRLFCGEVTIDEKIRGFEVDETYDIEIDSNDTQLVKFMLGSNMTKHRDIGPVLEWMRDHQGQKINIERW